MSGGFTAQEELARVLAGQSPGYVDRLVKKTGSAMARFGMVPPGSRVLLGLSGGKDSLSLALALELCRRRRYADFDLAAARVDYAEYPLEREADEALAGYCAALGIPYLRIAASFYGSVRGKKASCYECARERKKLLIRYADAHGFDRIAFAHHLDDVAGTALVNLVKHARLEPMAPVRLFFGKVRVVRPFCALRESAIRYFSGRLGLPVASIDCPRKGDNERLAVAGALANLEKIDKLVRENIFKAMFALWSDGEESWHGNP